MAQTRAQKAAKRRRNLEDENTELPHTKRPRPTTHQRSSKEPPIQSDLSSGHSPNRQNTSRLPYKPSNAATNENANNNPIDFWRKEGRWPRAFSEPGMEHLLARKRSLSALGGRKRTNSASSTTASDQKPREEKNAQYRDPRYETLLATKGSFMVESPHDITDTSKATIEKLLSNSQLVPQDTLFRDDVFKRTYQKIHNKNEARIIQDISRLLVPSAESFATFGAEHLEILIESVNEGWNNSIPLTGTRPQPDYSVGFQREAFNETQLEKLSPFIGDFIGGDTSYFMATYLMYFPFLACEVKCGAAALDIADRQNAHSMTLATRGVVELFRLVGRENEVHQQVLAFSISHDHRSVRIYGHYPVIEQKGTKYYRYPIRTFDFTEMGGKEKWTAYCFTKNVYDIWMPDHFKRICSAIDQLSSNVSFDDPSPSESTGLSQAMETLGQAVNESAFADHEQPHTRTTTPNISFSTAGSAKRRKSPAKKHIAT